MSKFKETLEKMEKRYDKKRKGKRTYFLENGGCKAYLECSGNNRILVMHFECSNSIIKNDKNKVAVVIVEKAIVWMNEVQFLLIEGSSTFGIHANVEVKKEYDTNKDISFGVIGNVYKTEASIKFESEVLNFEIINVKEKVLPNEMVAVISEKTISIENWKKEYGGLIKYPFWLGNQTVEVIVE